jgi:hypothetical protein
MTGAVVRAEDPWCPAPAGRPSRSMGTAATGHRNSDRPCQRFPRMVRARKGNLEMVNLSEQFALAFDAAASDSTGPEMTAVQLSTACVGVLPVAGAGISVFGADGFRAPIGASHDEASAAERLQFTTGEGPCLAAHTAGRTVLAGEAELAARWPEFHQQLTLTTPYTAIASIPLSDGLAGIGALDLYFHRSADLVGMNVTDALIVAGLIARILAQQTWHRTVDGSDEPPWLNTPATRARAAVSVAMGMVAVLADLNFTDALAVLRARAHSAGRTLDDLCAAVVSGAVPTETFDL